MLYSYGHTLMVAENINLDYQNRNILHDINFKIDDVLRPNVTQGQVISLIGKSGIGKTQLFKILAGFNTPTSGNIFIKDRQIVKEGDVGVVPQNYALFNHRKVWQNLKLACKHGVDDHYVNYYAEKLELLEHKNKYPYQLSGGQRQRVSICQQLLADHDFILLDEPFSGLDYIMIGKLLKILQELIAIKEQLTIFIISHDIENSLIISDTAMILAKKEVNKGATIIKNVDLIKEGCAWQYDPENINFRKVLKYIKELI